MKANKILVPVDFSESSDAALNWATVVARDTGATLLIIHVETVPLTTGGGEYIYAIPEPPTYDAPRFPSIEAALKDGPKFFQDLMAAVGSKDGREIVRILEDLRLAGRMGRDKEGRWVLDGK